MSNPHWSIHSRRKITQSLITHWWDIETRNCLIYSDMFQNPKHLTYLKVNSTESGQKAKFPIDGISHTTARWKILNISNTIISKGDSEIYRGSPGSNFYSYYNNCVHSNTAHLNCKCRLIKHNLIHYVVCAYHYISQMSKFRFCLSKRFMVIHRWFYWEFHLFMRICHITRYTTYCLKWFDHLNSHHLKV